MVDIEQIEISDIADAIVGRVTCIRTDKGTGILSVEERKPAYSLAAIGGLVLATAAAGCMSTVAHSGGLEQPSVQDPMPAIDKALIRVVGTTESQRVIVEGRKYFGLESLPLIAKAEGAASFTFGDVNGQAFSGQLGAGYDGRWFYVVPDIGVDYLRSNGPTKESLAVEPGVEFLTRFPTPGIKGLDTSAFLHFAYRVVGKTNYDADGFDLKSNDEGVTGGVTVGQDVWARYTEEHKLIEKVALTGGLDFFAGKSEFTGSKSNGERRKATEDRVSLTPHLAVRYFRGDMSIGAFGELDFRKWKTDGESDTDTLFRGAVEFTYTLHKSPTSRLVFAVGPYAEKNSEDSEFGGHVSLGFYTK